MVDDRRPTGVAAPSPARPAPAAWSPWRAVLALGVVSLAADMVYEGMRSMAGPYLGSLGASALTVGVVTGAGEGVALALRLVTGPWADRPGARWRLSFLGYGLTAVCVPLLALAPFLGAAGVAVASALILAERTGKAIRSPAKSALLAGIAVPLGRGRGFAVHKALDQVGAFAGPLVVAGMAAATGLLWPGFLVLAVPGAAAVVLLAVTRRRTPDATALETTPVTSPRPPRARLPRAFYAFATSCALTTAGLMTFGVISLHLVDAGLMSAPWVPVVYAGAMALAAIGALATGSIYDRRGGAVLLPVPCLVAVVPALAYSHSLGLALVGIAAWGLAAGVQDSTVKALVADLVPGPRLGAAYGTFAALQGAGALVGGTLAGALAADHHATLVAVLVAAQAASLVLLLRIRL